jgi:uncharacterized protein YbgA (DUF1722 family)/uncharacterized protein YbbK (DUF523 family)
MNATPRLIRVGISSCLLGETVRYDGGHRRDRFLTDVLGPFVEWVPVCPEVECGFGTPREPMRLVHSNGGVRLLTVVSRRDLTNQLEGYAARRIEELLSLDLCGYVVKKDSPSCGMERVKVYDEHGLATRSGRGLFTSRLQERSPNLPIEEEGRLSDPRLRENFVERVFAYGRLRDLFGERWSLGTLVAFHTAHKLLLMAHSVDAYQRLGQFVGRARGMAPEEIERRYTRQFMAALSLPATRPRHANVLLHMIGYFRDGLDHDSRLELMTAIEEYRRELVPLAVPVTLFRHHIRVREVSYLAGQLYLDAFPKGLWPCRGEDCGSMR